MILNHNTITKVLTLLSLLVVFSSCDKSYNSTTELNDYLNNSKNGCIKSKSIGKINVTVKYVPFSYMVLKNLQGTTEKSFTSDNAIVDSLLEAQSKFLTFIMTITPKDDKDNAGEIAPIMYQGLEDEAGFVDRVFSMNFSLTEYVKLYAKEKYTEPVAAFVENVYELSDGRNFLITFPEKDLDRLTMDDEISFVFTDPYFNTGTLQFHFNREDILTANVLNVAWDKI